MPPEPKHQHKKKPLFIFMLALFFQFAAAQIPSLQWVRTFGNPGSNLAYSITHDAAGNIYATGAFSGTVDFDPGPGIFNLVSASGSNVYVSKFDGFGNFIWTKAFNGGGLSSGLSIAVESNGNVVVTGNMDGTVDFDPGLAVFNLTAFGADDIFVVKLDAAGSFLWAKQMGGGGMEDGESVAVDVGGNVYTTGYFQGAGDYDPGPGTAVLNPGGADVFISKLDAAGNFVWAKQFATGSTGIAKAIKVDAAGNVYTAGHVSAITDFDTGPGFYPLNPAGSNDVFVAKLNSSGALVWAALMGGTYPDYCFALDVDAGGNVYATGLFEDIADFDPGAGSFSLTAAGQSDVFVCKLTSTGTFGWVKQISGASFDYATGIKVDAAGNIYSSGYFQGTTDFDPGPATYNLISAGMDDAYISKLDASGAFVWAMKIGGPSSDICRGISVDAAGSVYTAGYFNATCDFDPTPASFTVTSQGNYDIFIHKMCIAPDSPTNITSPGDQNICNGTSASLTVNSNGVINWYTSPSGGSSIGTGSTFVTPTLSTGTYTFYADATTCFTSTRIPVGVSVTLLPAYSVSTSVFLLCPGETSTLYASGVSNCTWMPGALVGTAVIVSPSVTTTYSAIGSNGPGCTNTVTITQAVSSCDGIEELSFGSSGIRVFPNPAQHKVNIVNVRKSTPVIDLYTSLGILVRTIRLEERNTILELDGLPCGVYFFRIKGEPQFGAARLIKQ